MPSTVILSATYHITLSAFCPRPPPQPNRPNPSCHSPTSSCLTTENVHKYTQLRPTPSAIRSIVQLFALKYADQTSTKIHIMSLACAYHRPFRYLFLSALSKIVFVPISLRSTHTVALTLVPQQWPRLRHPRPGIPSACPSPCCFASTAS